MQVEIRGENKCFYLYKSNLIGKGDARPPFMLFIVGNIFAHAVMLRSFIKTNLPSNHKIEDTNTTSTVHLAASYQCSLSKSNSHVIFPSERASRYRLSIYIYTCCPMPTHQSSANDLHACMAISTTVRTNFLVQLLPLSRPVAPVSRPSLTVP